MAISRFERGLQKPPADCFIALGKLAGSRSGWYFWHMAGVTVRDVRRMMAPNWFGIAIEKAIRLVQLQSSLWSVTVARGSSADMPNQIGTGRTSLVSRPV
jgi:hypothetical protein